MKHLLLATAALSLAVLPVFAQTKPLTPPKVLGAAKTIQFTVTEIQNGKVQGISAATLAAPNKAYIVDTDPKTKAVMLVYASDGKTQTEYRAPGHNFVQSPAPSEIAGLQSHTAALNTLTDFFGAKAFAQFHHSPKDAPGLYRKSLGAQGRLVFAEALTIDPATGLPKSLVMTSTPTHYPSKVVVQMNFSQWHLNTLVDDSKFAYTPPADAKLYTAPVLLAAGTAAPDFTVQDKNGKAVKLSDYRGKTVVLDFWATWCGPCQSSLPHTTAMAKKYADKNVVVLAVNVWDTPAAFQAWLPKHPEYAPLHFAIDPNTDQSKCVASALYGVSGIPTQYIIDPNGTVLKSIVGYGAGDTQLDEVLKTSAK